MATNPVSRGCESPAHKAIRLPMGVTAVRKYDLIKMTSGLAVPAADNDENLQVYVALENADASESNGVLAVPMQDAVLDIGYTGTVPALPQGESYGISDTRTLDFANTTQLLLRVISVDTDREIAKVILHEISA